MKIRAELLHDGRYGLALWRDDRGEKDTGYMGSLSGNINSIESWGDEWRIVLKSYPCHYQSIFADLIQKGD